MSWRLSALRGRPVVASDGAAGALNDLYFDDRIWTARYLAVDNGKGQPGRVLVRPSAAALRADGTIALARTREQVKRSIARDTDPHLLGGRELSGYDAEASDGAAGALSDLLIESDWSIAGAVLRSGDWLLPARQIELPVSALAVIDRAARVVRLSLTRGELRRVLGP